MKSKNLLVLACLVSMPVLAQTLPDEINYGPYETRLRTAESTRAQAEAQLNASRSSLAEAKKFIAEMTAHISNLQGDIAQNQNEIARLRNEIPVLERQIVLLQNDRSNTEADLRNRQHQLSNLEARYNQAVRDIRPLEDIVRRKQDRFNTLQNELAQHQRTLRDAESRYNQTAAEASRIDRAFEDARSEQRTLENQLRTVDQRINSVNAQISQNESSLNSQRSNLNMERSKLASLDARVAEYSQLLATQRANNAPQAEIQDTQRKLSAATSTRNNTANGIKTIEANISRTESQIATLRRQSDEIRREQQTLPPRIAQLESRQRDLTNQRAQVQSALNRYTVEVNQARSNVATRTQAVEGARIDLQNDQNNLMRQKNLADALARDVQSLRTDVTNLSNRSRDISNQIANCSNTIRQNQTTIPRLEQNIRTAQSEIADGESDLVVARKDEVTFTQAVARDEAKLAEATRARDNAQGERDNRFNLYQRYLSEAEGLGADQAQTGNALGEKEGARLVGVLSKQNGSSAGRELGLAEAKYWGSVRGEIQGYDQGYAEGLNSTEDRTRAINEAGAKAAVDAELFAQRNNKPVYFEEFVQAEFKKTMTLKAASLLAKSMKSFSMNVAMEASMDVVNPLTPAELSRSAELKTPLDASIVTLSQDVKTVEAKAERLRSPEVTFEAPTKIPFGTVNCNSVYKGLAVFKASCEGSYRGAFTNNYVDSARRVYSGTYSRAFEGEFNAANVSEREARFASELAAASKIGRAEGLRVGKIDIYQQTYASTYESSYQSELVKAKEKAKSDASRELSQFLSTNPLLTVSESGLKAENFRGDEEVQVALKVKNVGSVALKGPVMVRFTEVLNANSVLGEAVLNSAAPLAVTDLPLLKVKVLPTAKAGEKVIVRGVVDLPGDLYRPTRQEKFELVQTLSANPAHDLNLNYNNKPDIKGIFRRNIHFLSVKIQPKVEEIKDGYSVTLTPVAEAGVVDLNEKVLSTGAVAAGTAKELRFSYTFKDQAKNKTVKLELAISYLGKVIKKETITLLPH